MTTRNGTNSLVYTADIFGSICEWIKRRLSFQQAQERSTQQAQERSTQQAQERSKCKNAKINGFLHTFSNNQKITGLLLLFTSYYILSTKHGIIMSICI